MPLFDHFRPPLRRRRRWESFHSAWATYLAQQLNDELPRNFVAEVQVQLSVQVEADVAALEGDEDDVPAEEPAGGILTAVWAPPRPTVDAGVDFADIDLFEVQVRREDDDLQVVAAVELVSPANKDRPTTRNIFAAKCASYLHQGVSALVVDVVTTRRANLHRVLFDLIGVRSTGPDLGNLYTASYRTITRRKRCRLEAWTEPLAVGEVLPTLPLWIAPDRAVPVNLEQSYLATCAALRLRA